jgi:hypothetical protein
MNTKNGKASIKLGALYYAKISCYCLNEIF